MPTVAIVAGIDEAGYGPVVGPLVTAATAFEVDDALVDANLWRVLSPTVTRRPTTSGSRRVAVDDSKRLYSGGRGLDRLETGVLAFLAACGCHPPDTTGFLDHVAPGASARARALPWYAALDSPLPGAASPDGLESCAAALAARLTRAGVRPTTLAAEPLLAPELNRLIDHGLTKADAAMTRVAVLVARLRDAAAGRHLVVHLDRQGGRTRYLEPLRRIFDDAWIWVLEETPRRSAYRVEDDRGTAEVRVSVGGDRLQLPVALASMTAKLVRELMMAQLNRYWCARLPDLRPTAGYPTDGRRFVEAVTPLLAADGLPADRLVRRR